MAPTPHPQPPVIKVLTTIAGGDLRGEQEGESLVLQHAPRDGCSAIIVILWSIFWTAFVLFMAREVARHPDPRGISCLAVAALMDVAAWGYAIYSLFATDQIRVDRERLVYTRRVLIPIRRREVLLTRIENVDLRTTPTRERTQTTIRIDADDGILSFGKGVDPEELARWAKLLRERVMASARHTMPAPVQMEQVEDTKLRRHQQAMEIVLNSMHVTPEQVAADPALRRKVMERVANSEVFLRNEERSRSAKATNQSRSRLGQTLSREYNQLGCGAASLLLALVIVGLFMVSRLLASLMVIMQFGFDAYRAGLRVQPNKGYFDLTNGQKTAPEYQGLFVILFFVAMPIWSFLAFLVAVLVQRAAVFLHKLRTSPRSSPKQRVR